MHVVLVTPYLPESRNGNAHTAMRYARFLRAAGHRVAMMQGWQGEEADAMLALHARREHHAIARFAAAHADRPLILVLTGTDLYRDIRHDRDAQRSLELATRLVVLQPRGMEELPAHLHPRTRVILQSAPRRKPGRKATRHFDLSVVAHLRAEKDPFRAALASALLPPHSRIRIWHVGSEREPGLAAEAQRMAALHPRWHWLGSLSHGRSRERMGRSHLLVVSSALEGGANVIVEAVMSGTPVLASDIPGNRGMLGEDYAGYFPLADTRALADLMRRAETDPDFLDGLRRQCAACADRFEPALEAAAVAALLE